MPAGGVTTSPNLPATELLQRTVPHVGRDAVHPRSRETQIEAAPRRRPLPLGRLRPKEPRNPHVLAKMRRHGSALPVGTSPGVARENGMAAPRRITDRTSMGPNDATSEYAIKRHSKRDAPTDRKQNAGWGQRGPFGTGTELRLRKMKTVPKMGGGEGGTSMRMHGCHQTLRAEAVETADFCAFYCDDLNVRVPQMTSAETPMRSARVLVGGISGR